MKDEVRNNKDNLIIATLIGIQSEIEATRDITMLMLSEMSNFSENQKEDFGKLHAQMKNESFMKIIASIKAKHISKNESINDLLRNLFPEDGTGAL